MTSDFFSKKWEPASFALLTTSLPLCCTSSLLVSAISTMSCIFTNPTTHTCRVLWLKSILPCRPILTSCCRHNTYPQWLCYCMLLSQKLFSNSLLQVCHHHFVSKAQGNKHWKKLLETDQSNDNKPLFWHQFVDVQSPGEGLDLTSFSTMIWSSSMQCPLQWPHLQPWQWSHHWCPYLPCLLSNNVKYVI